MNHLNILTRRAPSRCNRIIASRSIRTRHSEVMDPHFADAELSRNPFYNYTSGRWLWDEKSQLHKRHQPFNVDRLKEVAATCANANTCVSMTKLPEGSFNKAFLLTMDNGAQVVARIPNPYLPPKVATGSEVATLDFLRNELNIPVPQVLAWSSEKDQPVGAEYIIMEKAPGQELSKIWPSMDVSDKVDIVSQLVNIQAKICSVDFKYYGSLYYRGQASGHHDIPGIPSRFCIGPSSALRFWEAERRTCNKYKGPWSSPISYAEDVAKREINWISQFATPRDVSDPLRQSTSQESPRCHLQLLDKYLKVISQVVPSDHDVYRSTIWHSDLHFGNIFVEKNQIVSIIDWQGCTALPLFLTCKIPKFLRLNGPLLFDLPPAAGLTAQEKKETLFRYQLTQLQSFYCSKFRDLDNGIFRAMSDEHAMTRQQLVDFAGSTWEDDGLLFFRETLRQVLADWNEIANGTDSNCPITLSSNELSSHAAERKVWDEYKALFDSLGIPIDGWVHLEDFESAADTMRKLVTEIIATAENQEAARRAMRAWKLTDQKSTVLSSRAMDI
ncbi:hypothetical protein FQN50_003081 [Emmonsiellopsis sp. PD_5]|nr:hypothetical protein FQN50_003081 [Emmonsiellopsis sp. PD_5]